MVSELQRQIADAVRAGAHLDQIEEAIIERAPVDEDQRAALWLYAEALVDHAEGGSPTPDPDKG